MNHNHIYSDSVSCEQLKAVDIIFKEEGHVCPTNTLTNKTTTNEKYTNIVQPAVPAIVLLEIFGSPSHYLSNVFGCPAY
jgi:hypothetical protein